MCVTRLFYSHQYCWQEFSLGGGGGGISQLPYETLNNCAVDTFHTTVAFLAEYSYWLSIRSRRSVVLYYMMVEILN